MFVTHFPGCCRWLSGSRPQLQIRFPIPIPEDFSCRLFRCDAVKLGFKSILSEDVCPPPHISIDMYAVLSDPVVFRAKRKDQTVLGAFVPVSTAKDVMPFSGLSTDDAMT